MANTIMKLFILLVSALIFSACGGDLSTESKTALKNPNSFVGSERCKECHLEHYDSWKMTQHSRMTQDAQEHKDAILAEIDENRIRAELKKLGPDLKIPVESVYIPKVSEIKYIQGSQWKQQYLIEKQGKLYVAPVQYEIETNTWLPYHEDEWDKKPWITECGGCHVTGVDIEKNTFSEVGIACESCHGKGAWHAALPKTSIFEKRRTIVNPSKLPVGVAVQICGSCHSRGTLKVPKNIYWPVGYEPGMALGRFLESPSYVNGDVKTLYAKEFSKGHHQQYSDWKQSVHFQEGVTCTSCHFVHQLGSPPTRSQTMSSGSQQCFECHALVNKAQAHVIHSFGNCVGCHMPRIAKSPESGAVRSHTFLCLLPIDTLKNPDIPNSCQTCHKHKDADLLKLQKDAFPTEEIVLEKSESTGEEKPDSDETIGGKKFF